MKNKKINVIIILFLILFLIFTAAGIACAEVTKDAKTTEIVYKNYGPGQNIIYEGDTMYLVRNTPYTLGAVKAEVNTVAVNIPPEYKTPETEDYYRQIEEEFQINGTVKLKIYRGSVLVKELEELKTNDENTGSDYYGSTGKQFKVNLDEGEYLFKLSAGGSDLINSERNVKVIKEKGQEIAYQFGFQSSESPADTIYMAKANDLSVGFEIRKEIDKEYFDKIGVNRIINDRGWVDVEPGSEMILELSGGGETKQYSAEKTDGDWMYNNRYAISIKDKGSYNVRLINTDNGKVLEGSERIIRVIDASSSFIPFLLALIPVLSGITILILRRRGDKT